MTAFFFTIWDHGLYQDLKTLPVLLSETASLHMCMMYTSGNDLPRCILIRRDSCKMINCSSSFTTGHL